MSEPEFSNPDEAMDYLRMSWDESMRSVPEARRPRAMHSGWPLGLLPAGTGLPIETGDGPCQHPLAETGFYILAPIPGTGEWGLYQAFGPVVQLIAPLVTSLAVFPAEQPVPSATASVLGTDGIGILLETDTGPARLLLLDGYTYSLSRAHNPGRWTVHEAAATSTDTADW